MTTFVGLKRQNYADMTVNFIDLLEKYLMDKLIKRKINAQIINNMSRIPEKPKLAMKSLKL